MTTKVLNKRTAILNTALDLLVENGFHNTPMSMISKKAGVSAGIIYHYFDSKEELILELYREIKNKFVTLLFTEELQKKVGVEALSQVWKKSFHFYVDHPRETLFLEQFENSPYKQLSQDDFKVNFQPFLEWLEGQVKTHQILDVPEDVLNDLTFGIAISLAKKQIAGTLQVDDALLDKVVKAILRSIKLD